MSSLDGRWKKLGWGLGFGVQLLCASARAEEVTPDQCLAAHEQSQLTRTDGRLLEARTALLVCQRLECPAIVRRDCVNWLSDVNRDIPTITVSARSDGVDQTNGSFSLDGVEVSGALGGREISTNPGKHTVKLVLPDGRTEEKVIVMTVGERARNVSFEWATKAAPKPDDSPAPLAPKVYERPIPVWTYYFAGAAGVLFLTSGTFGIVALAEKGSLDCAPFCSADQKASVDTKLLVGDITLGVGAAAAVTAGLFYVLRPSVEVKPEATSMKVVFTGSGVVWGGTF